MKNSLTSPAKLFTLSVAIIASVTLCQSAAQAQELTVNYSTSGIIYGMSEVSFSGGSFTETTTRGCLTLSPENNNLGSFTLLQRPAGVLESAFDLFVHIHEPGGILGGNTRRFPATLFLFSEGLLININTPTQTFVFYNASGSGSFTITVDSFFIPFDTAATEFQAALSPLQVQTANCPSFPCTVALTGTATRRAGAGDVAVVGDRHLMLGGESAPWASEWKQIVTRAAARKFRREIARDTD